MLPPTDVLSVFAPRFAVAGIEWMVAGGVAAILYGEPRFTQDIDVVVEMQPHDAQRLVAAFPDEDFYCPPIEVIEEEAQRPVFGHFNLLHLETDARADVYLAGDDALAHRGLAHRRWVRLFDMDIPVAPPEHVILHKLRFRREGASDRHLRDVRTMLRVLGDSVDQHALENEVRALGLLREWEAMRNLRD
ncbi:hypothetical protein [Gemmatimonas aurantiaca]|uniref:hypothetical protein n=1 Tax=Gemmatimonas aurantiaca TaxID=173480 RepID=UPI00301B8557